MHKLKVGDLVEVRSKNEILKTLDRNGTLEGLPFMPEMFQYCGMRFPVYKRAHKTCDTINRPVGRGLSNTVHLNLRCNGDAHGGCQASCLFFWKEAWLIRVDGSGTCSRSSEKRQTGTIRCSEDDVWAATRDPHASSEGVKWRCQATQLPFFTQPLPWWDLRQYFEDWFSGNVPLGTIFRGFLYSMVHKCRRAIRFTRPFDFVYDGIQRVYGGLPFPRKCGKLIAGQETPAARLDLQPGELVRIKPYREILATLDSNNKNRGLFFDAEAVPYCGKTFRVQSRLTNFIDEKTGTMTKLKTPAVILEGVWCQARYSNCRMHCPRSIYTWWREVWLERVPEREPGEAIDEIDEDVTFSRVAK